MPSTTPFRLIAFDWDGTAVSSRSEDAGPARGPIERLLRSGVLVVVITGTNLQNIDRQLASAIRGRHKRNLYLATNRGSEVYGFDETFAATLLCRRTATEQEDRALTAIAEAVRDHVVSRTGLDVRVVYDRLNRRKVDLIPLEEWKDPPKSAIGELLVAVERRLEAGGLAHGLQDVIDVTRDAARSMGLPHARITSDVKHVEIGLTDKADSVTWILEELARPRGIRPEEILIAGDEFGPLAGFPGSDSRMLVAASAGATVVSVGPEPAGVPAGVVHLAGGPRRFRELLAGQAALHPVTLPATPEQDPAWTFVEEGFVLTREHEIESLFAISNGFVGARASLPEGSALSAAGTFVAGVFDRQPGSVPELVRAPDWMNLVAAIDGKPLRLDAGEPLRHRRVLDLRQGILWRQWHHKDPAGRVTRLEGMWLASLADRHLLLQSFTLVPENYSGTLTVESVALSRSVSIRLGSGAAIELVAQSRIDDPEGRWTATASGESGSTPERWTFEIELGKTYRVDRLACVHVVQASDGAAAGVGRARLQRTYEQGLELAVDAHRAAWRARWEASDVQIDGDPEAQRAIRFALYHLSSAAHSEDEHVSIGARALTGAAYKGHVFWDTEIFMLPFFTLTYPQAARAMLMYRHHTLPAARARAARLGYQGALYAWESADTGEDVTPALVVAPTGEVIRIRSGDEEQHISADVAYGVWQYWRATGDERFLRDAGAEILVETARFWASRATREEDGRYHIRGVIGPDEYHETVDDNAYTNGMARWNLETGAEAATLLAERWPAQAQRIRIGLDEPRQWLQVARNLHVGLDPRTGIIEQFQGYFDLEDIDLGSYPSRAAPMDVLLGRERIQRSQIIKQPDVVMLLYLLRDRYPADVQAANFRYYEPRTSHGSSLSPPIHACVAAQLGDVDLALRYFRQTADIDLSNTMGNAAGGVHAAALGGLWQAVTFGFAGLSLSDGGPRLQPRLPAAWRGLRFQVQWGGGRFPLDARHHAGSAPTEEAHP
jgi:kojibiose phosphorylase